MLKGFSSITSLHDSLVAAAETERRLPAAIRKQKLASWPEYLLDWTLYTTDGKTNVKLDRATAKQITRYDFVLDSIIKLQRPEDRKVLWFAAHSAAFKQRGPGWTKIAKVMKTNRRTVKQKYESALFRLFYSLAAH